MAASPWLPSILTTVCFTVLDASHQNHMVFQTPGLKAHIVFQTPGVKGHIVFQTPGIKAHMVFQTHGLKALQPISRLARINPISS